jgi:hypothetical protein
MIVTVVTAVGVALVAGLELLDHLRLLGDFLTKLWHLLCYVYKLFNRILQLSIVLARRDYALTICVGPTHAAGDLAKFDPDLQFSPTSSTH